MTRRMINVGCGNRTHSDWINLDLVSHSPDVMQHDLMRGLPFADNSCDAVYHSHVLEHLAPEDGRKLVAECWRVLKPGGVLRVVVPDLENISRAYLDALDHADGKDETQIEQLQWMRIELFDQMVRSRSGGKMLKAARDAESSVRDFVESRVGDELFETRHDQKKKRRSIVSIQRLKKWARKIRHAILFAAVGLIGGRAGHRALQEGLFRQSGEIHQWMYDRISLAQLMESTGFESATVCAADESTIDDFARFELDTKNNRVRKPDSLFMEAIKVDVAANAQTKESKAA